MFASSSVRRTESAWVAAALTAVVAPAPSAVAATAALHVSPSGTGTSCSAADPCSLPTAQAVGYGDKCLEASGQGTANGTAVVIWDRQGGTNQQWSLR